VYSLAELVGLPQAVAAVTGYLAFINVVLAAFNLLPAFPLDGGRVLRAALWSWRGNLRWATSIASQIGSGFGVALMLLGILDIVLNRLFGGLWFLMIGLFLRNAARMSYRQLLVRRALEGERVRRFMAADLVWVPPTVSVAELVEQYVYRYHFKMFPVVAEGKLVGCVTTQQVKEIPRAEWERRAVGEICKPCSAENTISADADAMQALASMSRTGVSRLMVMEEGRLVGVISLKDLLRFFSLKLELEGE
jgi:CBS domain-containing protein